jgi:hypothetical protein
MLTLWAYDNNQITLTERLVKHNWQSHSLIAQGYEGYGPLPLPFWKDYALAHSP